jgi:hypothetical protein
MRHGTVRPIAQISSNVNKERENQPKFKVKSQKENEIWKKTANQSIKYQIRDPTEKQNGRQAFERFGFNYSF